jgi:hypothetical protein
MSDPYEMLTLDAEEEKLLETAMQEFANAEFDVKGDYPDGTWEAGGYWEMGQTIAQGIASDRVRQEFIRINGLA